MRFCRRVALLASAFAIFVACTACEPIQNSTKSDDPPDGDPPVAYFYRDGELSFAMPECYGYVTGVTVQDVNSVDPQGIWRLGSPRRTMLGVVTPATAGFMVNYGTADVAEREVDVVIETTLYSFTFLRLPPVDERLIPKPGGAYLQDGSEVRLDEFVRDEQWCANFSSKALK